MNFRVDYIPRRLNLFSPKSSRSNAFGILNAPGAPALEPVHQRCRGMLKVVCAMAYIPMGSFDLWYSK